MAKTYQRKGWLRELVDFALDQDVSLEIEQQRRILRENPGSAKAHFDLAVLLYSQRRVAEAIAEYEAALECDPRYASAYRKLGELYICAGDFESANRCAIEAAALGDRALLDMFERYPSNKEQESDPRGENENA